MISPGLSLLPPYSQVLGTICETVNLSGHVVLLAVR